MSHPCQAIVYVDAPTSKAKVVLDLIRGLHGSLPTNVTLFIPVGRNPYVQRWS